MPTLDELRRRYAGEETRVCQPTPQRTVDLDKIRDRKGRRLFREVEDEDAILLFGKYKDSAVSHLASHPSGSERPDYLTWVGLKADFCPPRLREIIAHQFIRFGHNVPW